MGSRMAAADPFQIRTGGFGPKSGKPVPLEFRPSQRVVWGIRAGTFSISQMLAKSVSCPSSEDPDDGQKIARAARHHVEQSSK